MLFLCITAPTEGPLFIFYNMVTVIHVSARQVYDCSLSHYEPSLVQFCLCKDVFKKKASLQIIKTETESNRAYKSP